MLDIFNLEKQAGKRVQKYLEYLAKEQNLESQSAALIIKLVEDQIGIYLFEKQKFIKTIEPVEICEFFDTDYEPSKILSVRNYLVKLAEENAIENENLNVVLSQVKGEISAHLYNGTKHLKVISAMEILLNFYSNN